MRSSSRPKSTRVSSTASSQIRATSTVINWGVLDHGNMLEAIKEHHAKTNRQLLRNQYELAKRLYNNIMDVYLTDLAGVCCFLRDTVPSRYSDVIETFRKGQCSQLFTAKIQSLLENAPRVQLELQSDGTITHSEKGDIADAFLSNRRDAALGDDQYLYSKATEDIVSLYVSDARSLNRLIRKYSLNAPEITPKDIIDPNGKLKSRLFTNSFRILVPLIISMPIKNKVTFWDQVATTAAAAERNSEDATLRITDLSATGQNLRLTGRSTASAHVLSDLNANTGANSIYNQGGNPIANTRARGSVAFSTAGVSHYEQPLSHMSLYGESLAEMQEKFDTSQIEKYRNQAKTLHAEMREKDLLLQEANAKIRELKRQLEDAEQEKEDMSTEIMSLKSTIDTLKTEAEYDNLEKEVIRLKEKQAVMKAQLDDALKLVCEYKDQLFAYTRKFDTISQFVSNECTAFNELVTKYNLERNIFEVSAHAFYDHVALLSKTLTNTENASVTVRVSTILRHVVRSIHTLIQESEKLLIKLRLPPLDQEELEELNSTSILASLDKVTSMIIEHLNKYLY